MSTAPPTSSPVRQYLRDLIYRTQRAGNTTALIDYARTHACTVVVHNRAQVERLAREGVKALSVRDTRPEVLLGRQGPYLLDMGALGAIAQDWDTDMQEAQRHARGLKVEVERLQHENLAAYRLVKTMLGEAERLYARIRELEHRAVTQVQIDQFSENAYRVATSV